MAEPLRALLVEDSEDDAALLLLALRHSGFEVEELRVDTSEALRAALQRERWDIVFCDYTMPRFSAPAALAVIRELQRDLPVIIVSGTVGEESAVEAMRAGAHDYFTKGKLGPRLRAAVERELAEVRVRRERAQTEAALRRTREQLAVLLSHSRAMVYMREPSGDFDVTYISDNARAILGYTPAECLQKGFWVQRVHPDDRAAVLGALRQVAERGSGSLECRFRHRDGSDRVLSDELILARDERGEPSGLVGSLRDVTEDRLLREHLLISDRMASMGTLAAGVAHEINNPLASVMANLELATRELTRLAREARAELALSEVQAELSDAREAAERIRNIVRDLKIFSRSRDEPAGAVDVRAVLESTLRMAWNEIRHRAQLVKLYGDTPRVRGTESRLGQVFLNLVVNAAQAIPDGRASNNEIRISTRTAPGGEVVVEIADTGEGIPTEALAQLFTPFFTTKPPGVGTGLGLSICRRIVTDLGGAIDVTSEVGVGTTFRVTLLAAEQRADAPAPRALSGAPAGRRGTILVVDDEPLIAKVLQRALTAEHDVTAVARAGEALALVAAGNRYDVILCDLMMPQMTGMDLHAELTRVAGEQAQRMVFLTGGAFTPRAQRFLDATGNTVIEKPFDAGQLRALINGRIDGRVDGRVA